MSIKKYAGILLIFILAFSCKEVNPGRGKAPSSKLKDVVESGTLRVVTDFNSISYFIYRGQPMGYQYEMLQELANYLGVKLQVVVNNNLQEKFNMLNQNKVDLIAVNLTVTKERKEQVEFTVPHIQTRQVLIQRKPANWKKMSSKAVGDSLLHYPLELGGKTVFVQRNSSYVQRLKNLSDEIGDSIGIVQVDEGVEDLIEDVAQGKIKYTVADENIAQVDQLYYDNIDISVPVSFRQNLAWAVAKGSDDLKLAIDNWLTEFKKTRRYAIIYRKYYQNERAAQILDSDYFTYNSGKISPYDALIKEYSSQIGWDWRLVASLIYQESRFNPQAKSWAGAYGLMQLMPSTGQRFGVTPTASPKQQIRAGVMFLQWLNDQFSDIPDSIERIKFVLASYNIGLGHILDARALAAKNGKDPDVWDDNVDQFLMNKSNPQYYTDPVVKYGYCRGKETYRYVADIIERYQHYKNLITR